MSNTDTKRRIASLDVLRGFALCGVLLANVVPIASRGHAVVQESAGPSGLTDKLMILLVHQRFLPIFSLLFGIGFSLMLTSAASRTQRPRVVLLRRLLLLLAIGVLHFALLWQGDILSSYALIGILVLLPSSWLPRLAVAVGAGLFLSASLILGDGRFTLLAGLFLTGSVLVRYGVIDRMDRSARTPAVLCGLLLVAAVPALWMQSTSAGPFWFSLAGLLVAGTYVCGMLAALKTALRPLLVRIFSPLGRMALTNYLSATVLVLAVTSLIETLPSYAVAVPILVLQWIWSALWLRHHSQGPLEALWRRATWGSRQPSKAPAMAG